jgi:hypothetical protein
MWKFEDKGGEGKRGGGEVKGNRNFAHVPGGSVWEGEKGATRMIGWGATDSKLRPHKKTPCTDLLELRHADQGLQNSRDARNPTPLLCHYFSLYIHNWSV